MPSLIIFWLVGSLQVVFSNGLNSVMNGNHASHVTHENIPCSYHLMSSIFICTTFTVGASVLKIYL